MRPRRHGAILLAASLSCAVSPALADVALLGFELSDNGDHDGYADTNETVELRIAVRNDGPETLAGVVATLRAIDGDGRVCVLDGGAALGDLAPGAVVAASDPFVLHVAPDVDRAAAGLGPFDLLAASFVVALQGGTPAVVPATLTIDLDLDAVPGGVPTTVLETFEGGSGFGILEVQNLDLGLHDDADPESGPADGWRCAYHEPYCTHASCTPQTDPGFASCSPGATASAADAVWWRLDGGRGLSGLRSAHFGIDLGPSLGFTTPTGSLEALATADPIPLAGGSPSLSFAHQASFLDDRSIQGMAAGETADRGIVAVQLADASGVGAGPWIPLEPHTNPYDAVPSASYVNCTFDPVDDGSTGDDLHPGIEPWDGAARRGPSSTCADRRVFAHVGVTSGFDPGETGNAPGPGLTGETGPGTWVESRVDLSRFAGRSVRIRFLASTTRIGDAVSIQDAFSFNPDPRDDGWWIDDVRVEGASTAAGAVSVDAKDNAALPVPSDGDGDGRFDACDNCPVEPNAGQDDADGDLEGDLCDPCTDLDGDGFGDPGFAQNVCAADNCPATANPEQDDPDGDGLGSACDICPLQFDPDQDDSDLDGAGDACDCVPGDSRTYPGAPETTDGADNQCPGDAGFGLVDELTGMIVFEPGDPAVLSWPAQAATSLYRVVAADRSADGSPPDRWCRFPATSNLAYLTGPVELPGQLRLYLVRPESPFAGSLGAGSDGAERGPEGDCP